MDIREIARRARVSTATASRAINRVPSVDPQLVKRVWKVVDALRFNGDSTRLWRVLHPDFGEQLVDLPILHLPSDSSSSVGCGFLARAECTRDDGRPGPKTLGRFLGDIPAACRARQRAASRGSVRRDIAADRTSFARRT